MSKDKPHDHTTEKGSIEAVFAHRFVLKRADGGRLLADLGPKGAEAFTLEEGTEVEIEGERKPSEIKVTTITAKGGKPIEIPHGKPKGESKGEPKGKQEGKQEGDEEIDPAAALAAVAKSGLEPVGEPRRKPKHFEVLARRGKELIEVHVELDGTLRKEKPADREKWADALAAH